MALLLCGGTAVHSLTRVVTWWCRLHGIPRCPNSRHPLCIPTWISVFPHNAAAATLRRRSCSSLRVAVASAAHMRKVLSDWFDLRSAIKCTSDHTKLTAPHELRACGLDVPLRRGGICVGLRNEFALRVEVGGNVQRYAYAYTQILLSLVCLHTLVVIRAQPPLTVGRGRHNADVSHALLWSLCQQASAAPGSLSGAWRQRFAVRARARVLSDQAFIARDV